MRTPFLFAFVRWRLRWAHRRLLKLIERLRRIETALSFHADRGGPYAALALARAADLNCILVDKLGPAADALARAIESEVLLTGLEEDDEAAQGEPRPQGEVLAQRVGQPR